MYYLTILAIVIAAIIINDMQNDYEKNRRN